MNLIQMMKGLSILSFFKGFRKKVIYTPEQRKIIHNELVASKSYLRTGSIADIINDNMAFCICNAVSMSQGKHFSDRSHLANKVIAERIYPHYTLIIWAMNVQGIEPEKVASISDCQIYRHKWLDELIKEFSD